LASGVTVGGGDLNVIHIMHIAAKGIIGFHDLRRSLLAWTAGGEEEVDEDILASIEDVKKVDFGAVAVGGGEVNGSGEWTLGFQAKAQHQCKNKE
jgi:hypothetical protein